MREILFKAKRLDNGKWVEGYCFQRPNDPTEEKHYIVTVGKCKWYEINSDTLCEFTGLTDRDGNKIWENDILELPDEDGYFTCKWEEDTARFAMNGDMVVVDFDNYWSYQVRTIGNKFDNSELLEE